MVLNIVAATVYLVIFLLLLISKAASKLPQRIFGTRGERWRERTLRGTYLEPVQFVLNCQIGPNPSSNVICHADPYFSGKLDSTERVLRSLCAIVAIELLGWGSNSITLRLWVLLYDQMDTYNAWCTQMALSYLLVIATTVDAPVLYIFR